MAASRKLSFLRHLLAIRWKTGLMALLPFLPSRALPPFCEFCIMARLSFFRVAKCYTRLAIYCPFFGQVICQTLRGSVFKWPTCQKMGCK